ncbi:MAG TPA: polysaccharide biosynthesis tyrosine autokinase [Planctomycetaceae bacterium]|nr:polysaccharide biosynthesis tyrosine autokinase [Planctomycetaceae bacterium]
MTRELEFHASKLPGHADGNEETVLKPVNFVSLALRYRWWLVVGGACGLMLGYLVYLKSGPEYEATAQILVSRKTVPLREEQRMLSDWGERSEHIALIMSPMIANNAVEIGQLQKLPTFKASTDVVEDILTDLKVKRSSGQDRSYMNVLGLTYASRYPADARAVVSAMIKAYEKYLAETRNEKSNEALGQAQRSHDDVLEKLQAKEREYHEFRATAPLHWKAPVGGTSPDGQSTTNLHQDRVLAAEEQRRLNLLRQAEVQSRITALEAALARKEPRDVLEVLIRRYLQQDGSGFEDQRQQDISIFENRLLPLILEEKRLLRDYGPDHPDVKLVRQSMATALEFYRRQGIRLPEERAANGETTLEPQDFISLYVASLKQEIAERQGRDRELDKIVQKESAESRGVAVFQAKDETLNSELSRLRDLWEQLANQINQVDIEKDGSGYTLRQIAPVKDELSIKKLLKFAGAGCLFGLALVGAICVLREVRDTRLNTLAELRHVLEQPLLGTITRFAALGQRRPDLARVHPALRYLHAPHSLEAENYRSLRSAINVVCESSDQKIIQVSSPEPGDGKTTTVANLALAAAQSGKKVLLIDADLRRPMLHTLFGLPEDIGLSEVLAGEIEFLNAIRPTTIETLSVLPAGKPPTSPSELLSSSALSKVLADARREFDLVFVDGPPLLAVSDPCIIGRQTDGLLLVLRLGKTSLQAVRQTRDLVQTHALNVFGVVANGLANDDAGAYADRGAYYRTEQEIAPKRELVEAGV